MKTIGRYIDQYDAVILVTWLRTTFPRRQYIGYWPDFLVLTMKELKRRGLNPEQVLQGLENEHTS